MQIKLKCGIEPIVDWCYVDWHSNAGVLIGPPDASWSIDSAKNQMKKITEEFYFIEPVIQEIDYHGEKATMTPYRAIGVGLSDFRPEGCFDGRKLNVLFFTNGDLSTIPLEKIIEEECASLDWKNLAEGWNF